MCGCCHVPSSYLGSGRDKHNEQMSLQTMANAWAANKLWTYTEVEHTQGSSPTNLYPSNTGVMGHRSEVREGMIWRWGEGGAYSGVLAQTLLGEMSCTTQKREWWVGTTRCMSWGIVRENRNATVNKQTK